MKTFEALLRPGSRVISIVTQALRFALRPDNANARDDIQPLPPLALLQIQMSLL